MARRYVKFLKKQKNFAIFSKNIVYFGIFSLTLPQTNNIIC